jgi:cytochrome c oxidase assembly protein subunit 15
MGAPALGLFVGLSFILPALYYVSQRKVLVNMPLRLLGISGLIGFQGFLGWYMVKSGLKDDLFAPESHPRVSQYRLIAHLGTACICYTAMLWNRLSILRTNALLPHPTQGLTQLTHLSSPPSVYSKNPSSASYSSFSQPLYPAA